MNIRIEKEKVGMVRVVIAIGNDRCGCLSTNYQDCEERGNILAVGFWHRHDERNLMDTLSREADLILNAYSKMRNYSGAIIGTEWKDYRKS